MRGPTTHLRTMILSDADREVMRPVTLRVVTQLLQGKLTGYAVDLFRQAYYTVYHGHEEPELEQGWDDYWADCLDVLESYREVKQRDDINKLLQWCRCSDCVSMAQNIKVIELAYSATQRKGWV